MFIDVDYRTAKAFLDFYNLVNLFTAQNWLKLGPQLPTKNVFSCILKNASAEMRTYSDTFWSILRPSSIFST